MYKIVITPSAKDDIRDAAEWYNSQKPGLGKILITRIKEKFKDLKNNPYVAQIRFDDVRVAILKQFPYSIHYKIKEDINIVLIHAILHESRNPEIWNYRAE